MARRIDCDVHLTPGSVDALAPYLSEHWNAYLTESAFRAPKAVARTFPAWSGILATPTDPSLESLRRTVLPDVDFAVAQTYFGVESLQHPYLAPALATAVNDWIAEQIAGDRRLLASAVVTPQFAEAAVAEIERVAANPQFVQVLLPLRSLEPYGTQRFWPIWEAAERHGLALGLHYGGATAQAPTPVGWLDSLFEEHALAGQLFQAQVTSFLVTGVFNRFPALKLVVLESGWTWMPSLMWRADREWKALRRETPWLDELPSEYLRRHVRLTTQPIDGPATVGALREVVEQLESDRMLMYSSDFPHRYPGSADALLAALPQEHRERILWANAAECYALSAPSTVRVPPGG